MSKDAITDFSSTASSNEDIGGIAILGTSPRSNFDNALRELMSQLAEAYAGTAPVFDTFTFGDPGDLTKRYRFDAGSVTAGQTRVFTVPNYNGTLATQDGTETLTNKTLTAPVINAPDINNAADATFATSISVSVTDNGAGAGPNLYLTRVSASPAANDWMGYISFSGYESAGNLNTYAALLGYIVDPTNLSEDGGLQLQTQVAGTLATRMSLAQGLFMAGATGGDKGAGTVNATGFYINGTAFVPADYAAGNAALSVGGKGTYAFLRQATGATRSPGYTTAGSNLRYSDDAGGLGGTPSGTWMLMGEIVNANSASQWLRVS